MLSLSLVFDNEKKVMIQKPVETNFKALSIAWLNLSFWQLSVIDSWLMLLFSALLDDFLCVIYGCILSGTVANE